MHGFWSFVRAPLAWSFAVLALYAPFAFMAPVMAPTCNQGWFDCQELYVGLAFDPTPRPEHLFALLIVPSAFVAFLAAGVAARGPNHRAHWFMAGPVIALISGLLFFQFLPFHLFFVDTAHSYRPAMIVAGIQVGVLLGMLGVLPLAVFTLLGALAWRFRPRTLAAVGNRQSAVD